MLKFVRVSNRAYTNVWDKSTKHHLDGASSRNLENTQVGITEDGSRIRWDKQYGMSREMKVCVKSELLEINKREKNDPPGWVYIGNKVMLKNI